MRHLSQGLNEVSGTGGKLERVAIAQNPFLHPDLFFVKLVAHEPKVGVGELPHFDKAKCREGRGLGEAVDKRHKGVHATWSRPWAWRLLTCCLPNGRTSFQANRATTMKKVRPKQQEKIIGRIQTKESQKKQKERNGQLRAQRRLTPAPSNGLGQK